MKLQVQLTPVAIAAARRLADRLYGGHSSARLDYSLIPTVVFAHPPIATVGMTEAEARAAFGEQDVEVRPVPAGGQSADSLHADRAPQGAATGVFVVAQVFEGTSVNCIYGPWQVAPEEKPKTFVKLVCRKSEKNKVLGLHVVGMGADELMQGFAVAIKMASFHLAFSVSLSLYISLRRLGKARGQRSSWRFPKTRGMGLFAFLFREPGRPTWITASPYILRLPRKWLL